MARGALFSVGGTPAPIIEALKHNPVECALFVVSDKSEPQVSESILPAIGYSLQWECVRLKDADDLNTCYQQIRSALRDWIERRGLRNDDLYFDLTGGTKPMSAALTLAAVERIPSYHYVSGDREKEGLGTVISGTEKAVTGLNPWTRIAIRQRELATRLYEQGHVEAAAELLDQAAQIGSDKSETLKAFAGLCRALAKLDLFDFKGARAELGRWHQQLKLSFEHLGETQLITRLLALRDHLEKLDGERTNQKDFPHSLVELLANALRRGRQARYDDAIARLYRAVELFAQNRLYVAFGARSGRISLESVEAGLADRFRAEFPNDIDERNRLLLGCAKAFSSLKYSASEQDHRLVEVYDRLKPALEKRNDSWLAHGTRAANESDFQQMWEAVLKELGVAADTLPSWPQISFIE